MLACGAELKNTFCLTRDDNAFLSQHIGDLENLETLEHFESSIALYERLFRLAPEMVAYDLHPEYLASKYALALAGGARRRRSACSTITPTSSPAWSRTGASSRSSASAWRARLRRRRGLWGGEVLVCDLLGYRRVAHLEYLPLAGGALAIQRPARTAAGWLLSLLGGQRGAGAGATAGPRHLR